MEIASFWDLINLSKVIEALNCKITRAPQAMFLNLKKVSIFVCPACEVSACVRKGQQLMNCQQKFM